MASIEGIYPMYAWRDIWGRLELRLGAGVREVMYKFLHNILPSGEVLANRRVQVGKERCVCGDIDTAFHAVYFCERLEAVRVWFSRVIQMVGGEGISILRALSLDVGGIGRAHV